MNERRILTMKTFFWKRKIRNNIVSHLFKTLIALILIVPFLMAFSPKGKSTPRQVEKMRVKKEREAKLQYAKGVKMHMANQSKETKAMIKKAKKEAKKNMPVKPASRKKCP